MDQGVSTFFRYTFSESCITEQRQKYILKEDFITFLSEHAFIVVLWQVFQKLCAEKK